LRVTLESIYVRDGAYFVPTALAHGPWHADSQHGSAVSGLIAHTIDALPSEKPMQLTRLTVDLIHAAPMVKLSVQIARTHGGKSVEGLEVQVWGGDVLCARAHALRTRISELAVDESWSSASERYALDETAHVPLPSSSGPAFHDALHLSPVRGFAVPAMWVRMLKPLVQGEPVSQSVRAAVAVDWVYACVSLKQWTDDRARMETRPFVAINADNHMVLMRAPQGEWIGIDTRAHYGSIGAGLASANLFDARGVFGVATQTLLQRGLDKRPKAWG